MRSLKSFPDRKTTSTGVSSALILVQLSSVLKSGILKTVLRVVIMVIAMYSFTVVETENVALGTGALLRLRAVLISACWSVVKRSSGLSGWLTSKGKGASHGTMSSESLSSRMPGSSGSVHRSHIGLIRVALGRVSAMEVLDGNRELRGDNIELLLRSSAAASHDKISCQQIGYLAVQRHIQRYPLRH